MGFFDAMKNAVNVVTGGAASVAIEYPQDVVFPGDAVPVKIVVTSKGKELKSDGLFVDLENVEEVRIKKGAAGNDDEIRVEETGKRNAIRVAPALVLGAGETRAFEVTVPFPQSATPSFRGAMVEHSWRIRGRLEAFGNDPDSGWKEIRVGARN